MYVLDLVGPGHEPIWASGTCLAVENDARVSLHDSSLAYSGQAFGLVLVLSQPPLLQQLSHDYASGQILTQSRHPSLRVVHIVPDQHQADVDTEHVRLTQNEAVAVDCLSLCHKDHFLKIEQPYQNR